MKTIPFPGAAGIGYGGGAILLDGDGVMDNRDIVIRDNHLSSDYAGDISIRWADGVSVSGNIITGAAEWPDTVAALSPFLVSDSRAVSFQSNSVRHAAVYLPKLLSVQENAASVEGSGLLGIKALP